MLRMYGVSMGWYLLAAVVMAACGIGCGKPVVTPGNSLSVAPSTDSRQRWEGIQQQFNAALAQSQDEAARQLLVDALEGENAFAPDDPIRVEVKEALAVYSYKHGDYSAALAIYEELLPYKEEAAKENPPGLIPALNALAGLYIGKSEFGKAKELIDRAEGILAAADPPDVALFGQTLLVKAQLETERGAYKEAIETLDEARRGFNETLGEGNALTWTAVLQRGHVLALAGRYDEARDTFQEAQELAELAGGAAAPHRAGALMGFAMIDYFEQKYDDAKAKLEEADRIFRNAFSETHPQRTGVLALQGLVESALGNYEAAEKALQDAMTIRQQAYGPDSARTITIHEYMGESKLMSGDFAAADEHLTKALEARERILGMEHPDVASTALALARLRKAQGRPDDARALFDRALEIRTKAFGPESLLTREAADQAGAA